MEMMFVEIIDDEDVDEELAALYPIFSKLNKNFEVFEPMDSS